MKRKNIQTCPECRKQIVGEYRMKLMMGPKGYRSYAVHIVCGGNLPPAKRGGRQQAAARAKVGV